jgi:hypothetical protein
LFCELLHENIPADVALCFLKFSSAMSLFVQLTGSNLNLKSKTTLHRAKKYGIIAKAFGGIPMPIRHGLSSMGGAGTEVVGAVQTCKKKKT